MLPQGDSESFSNRSGAFSATDANIFKSKDIDEDERLRASAESIYDRKYAEAELIVDNADQVESILASAKNWVRRFTRKLTPYESLTTIIRMLKLTMTGEYQGVDKKTLACIIAAIVYCVSPVDAIPDVIPGIGLMDDFFVLSTTMRQIAKELKNFRGWERLSAAKNALSIYLPNFNEIKLALVCPGWMTENDSGDEIEEILSPIFPNARFEFFRWKSNVGWTEARDYVDADSASQLLDTLRDSGVELSNVALFGHSLGARMAVRALAALADEPEKKGLWSRKPTNRVAQAFLMGAAINADDPDIPKAALATISPLCNFYNRSDRALSYFYRFAEQSNALGLTGRETACEHYADCVVSELDEYVLDVADNVLRVLSMTNPKTISSQLAIFDAVSAGIPAYMKHQFSLYAEFFRDSMRLVPSR